jgi:hypothetical protein
MLATNDGWSSFAEGCADLPPPAEVTRRDGFGIGAAPCARISCHGRLERLSDEAVVGEVVQYPVGDDVEPALRRHDREALGQEALRLGEKVRVESELEDGAGSRLGGEFGVDDFVRPGADRAWDFDAQEDVRAPGPAALLERPLSDDV